MNKRRRMKMTLQWWHCLLFSSCLHSEAAKDEKELLAAKGMSLNELSVIFLTFVTGSAELSCDAAVAATGSGCRKWC